MASSRLFPKRFPNLLWENIHGILLLLPFYSVLVHWQFWKSERIVYMAIKKLSLTIIFLSWSTIILANCWQSLPSGKNWCILGDKEKKQDGMIGNPHLAQLIGQRHDDQAGTPLSTHLGRVRGHRLLRMAVFGSSLMIIGWFQWSILQNLIIELPLKKMVELSIVPPT